jgi:hypothetical protein
MGMAEGLQQAIGQMDALLRDRRNATTRTVRPRRP